VSLLEVLGGVGILSLTATAMLASVLGAARVASGPAARDRAFLAARNAVVEARAAAAYDANASAAILAAAPASWTANGIAFESSSANQTLFLSASAGTEKSSVAYSIVREALPQGAIVDTSGNLLTP
jgi:hypothetical protein